MLDELLEQLHAIDDGLFFELSEPHEGVNELVITAEGDRELFSLVDRVVAAAPQLGAWQVIALRPPLGFDFEINYEGIKLDPEKLWFMPLAAGSGGEHFGLRIMVPNLREAEEQTATNAVWVLLDTGLGERQCAEVIEHVEVARLPSMADTSDYVPLKELPAYLKARALRN
jgi:hypothetical protein